MANEIGQEPSLREKRHESRAGSTWKAFLRDVSAMSRLSLEESERAAVSVLGHLEKRLRAEEAEDLVAQLPSKLRELLEGNAVPPGEKPEKFGSAQFFERVAADLGYDREQAEVIARGVITVVRAQISEGEAEDVASQLPNEIAAIWLRPS